MKFSRTNFLPPYKLGSDDTKKQVENSLTCSRLDNVVSNCPMIGQYISNCPMFRQCMVNCPMIGQCISNCQRVGQCMSKCLVVGLCMSTCALVKHGILNCPTMGQCCVQITNGWTEHFYQSNLQTMSTCPIDGQCQTDILLNSVFPTLQPVESNHLSNGFIKIITKLL